MEFILSKFPACHHLWAGRKGKLIVAEVTNLFLECNTTTEKSASVSAGAIHPVSDLLNM